MWLRLHGVKTGQIHVAATVVDVNSRIAVDYYEDMFGGSSSDNTTATATAFQCQCVCERDHGHSHSNNGNVLLDDAVAPRAKMKQVNRPTALPPSRNCGLADDLASTATSSASYQRPKIKHVRVASVDSDRFEGMFDSRGNPILESRESLMFSNGGPLSASTAAVDCRHPSTVLPSVAEKAPTQRWESTDDVVPGGKARKRRTFMFLRPRATTPMTTSAAPSPPQISSNSNPSNQPKSHHRMNLKALYKRVSSEFRSGQDPAAAAALFEVPIGGCSNSVLSHRVGGEELATHGDQ